MKPLLETLAIGAASFAATNVDDLFVLVLFFTKAEADGAHRWPIVLGQYLGFSVLVLVSLSGCLADQLLSDPGIGFLGLVPIAMGIHQWRRSSSREMVRTETAVGKAASWGSSALAVAIVTMANGADNLGVYVPLFATIETSQLTLTLVVFGAGVAVWCIAGHWLGRHPTVAWTLRRRGTRLVPVLFVLLGVYILASNSAWRVFAQPSP